MTTEKPPGQLKPQFPGLSQAETMDALEDKLISKEKTKKLPEPDSPKP